MNDETFAELTAWLAEAGLGAASEADVLTGFCERAVAAGLPIGRAHVFVDTLHPVHEGAIFRWGQDSKTPSQVQYGRTRPEPSTPSGKVSQEGWRKSPFFRMLERDELLLRRRLTDAGDEFSIFAELRADGITDYIAIINRIAPDVAVGDMDCIYSSWMARTADGFADGDVAALERLMPFMALAIKAVSLTRTAHTLVKTYLGNDPARRVLSGRIERGVSDRIDAVLWFSDLRGFTRITDTAPDHVIPLLNDYADVIVSAVNDHGGDVLKLIGDGTLAIFASGDRAQDCDAALRAVIAVRKGVAALNTRRLADGRPATDMYLGLHVGEVFYGNIGSASRLDFTVIGPAVNEVARIAAMCRSADQPVLMSPAFAAVDGVRERLVSVGRYALRGIGKPQELFTLDPDLPA